MELRYNIGDIVSVKKIKSTCKIVDVNRYFKEVDRDGLFLGNGHAILEDSLSQFQVPYQLSNDLLIVDMPDGYYGNEYVPKRTKYYKVNDIAYTVDIPKFGYIVYLQSDLI